MTAVLESMSFGATGQQRQHGNGALEHLTGCSLLDGDHGGMVGRVAIKADHVRRLLIHSRIVRLHNARSVRVKATTLPRLRDKIAMNLQHTFQFPGHAIGLRLQRLGQYAASMAGVSAVPDAYDSARATAQGRLPESARAIDLIAESRHGGSIVEYHAHQ